MTAIPACTTPPAVLAALDGAGRLGLSATELRVLVAHARAAAAEPDCAITMLAAHEIAGQLGVSIHAIHRAHASLVAHGLLHRKQHWRRRGEVAATTLLPRALALLAGESLPEALPEALADLLGGQCASVISAVGGAWSSRTMPAAGAGDGWRGLAEGWLRVEDILRERAVGRAELDARQAQVEAGGGFVVEAANGERIEVNLSDSRNAPRPVDGFTVRRVVEQLAGSGLIASAAACVALVAELAYSRAQGFVRSHETRDAIPVLRSLVARGRWSRPRRITRPWYDYASRACRLPTGFALSAS